MDILQNRSFKLKAVSMKRSFYGLLLISLIENRKIFFSGNIDLKLSHIPIDDKTSTQNWTYDICLVQSNVQKCVKISQQKSCFTKF